VVTVAEDVATLLRAAADRLAAAGVTSPRWDAEQLLAHAAGTDRGRLPALRDLDDAAAARFADLVEQRAARVPLQHLVGRVGFRHVDLAVGPGVFIPRPETEVVAGAAVDLARERAEPLVVDLCAGSGAIALAVANEVPAAHVYAVELDPAALQWLCRNAAARVAAGDRPIEVCAGDASTALPELCGRVDVVVSNPPYVAEGEMAAVEPEVREHDPRVALVASTDGLAVVRAVVARAAELLRAGGWLIVEHSDRQGESVPELFRAAGFVDVEDRPDLAGRPRFTKGCKP